MLDERELTRLDRWWRAANYLSVGQIYLLDNPLLTEPLRPEHTKPRLLGHWGTTPGLNFIYAHLNRAIVARSLDVLYVCGPGHGGPGMSRTPGSRGATPTDIRTSRATARGCESCFVNSRFPGHPESRRTRDTGLDPRRRRARLLAVARVRRGVRQPRPDRGVRHRRRRSRDRPARHELALEQVPRPVGDGAVLPILHLNGWKIANPTVLARIGDTELCSLLEGYGHRPRIVSGDDPNTMHREMAAALDEALDEIAAIQHSARSGTSTERPRWPMLVLRTPKGWTGPAEVDGLPVEGTWRSHQVPLDKVRTNADHLAMLEAWLRSYDPAELFDETGAPWPETIALAPSGVKRMGDMPHANGGLLLRDLDLPDIADYAVEVKSPGGSLAEATRVLGVWLRDVMDANRTASGWSVPTRRPRTASMRSTRSPQRRGKRRRHRSTSTCNATAA